MRHFLLTQKYSIEIKVETRRAQLLQVLQRITTIGAGHDFVRVEYGKSDGVSLLRLGCEKTGCCLLTLPQPSSFSLREGVYPAVSCPVDRPTQQGTDIYAQWPGEPGLVVWADCVTPKLLFRILTSPSTSECDHI